MVLPSPNRVINWQCITSELQPIHHRGNEIGALPTYCVCLFVLTHTSIYYLLLLLDRFWWTISHASWYTTNINTESGTLASNGQKFDASRDRGRPFQFTIGIGQVIKGWDTGVMQMSLGEKAMLRITSDFGYGARGAGGVIPPNADLNFEVELLQIN